jgi:hypothetical protein
MANFTANYDARNIYKTSFLDKNCVAKTPIDTHSTFFFSQITLSRPPNLFLYSFSYTTALVVAKVTGDAPIPNPKPPSLDTPVRDVSVTFGPGHLRSHIFK